MEKISIEKGIGQRTDKFLKEEFFLYSRGEIIRKIKSGDVLVNGKTIKPSYILEEGDVLEIENFSKEDDKNILQPNEEILLDVIFEDENMLVINKQAGLQIHPSVRGEKNTLANALIAKYPEIAAVHDDSVGAQMRPGIVHRLDKDTSGVIVIAKNQKTFDELKNLFKNRNVQKKYLALVLGEFEDKDRGGVIDKPLARSSDYRRQVVARKNTKTIIRNAETEYRVIENLEKIALVEARPKTGRTHQIRIHLAAIGHPIIGDRVYGTSAAKNALFEAKRQLLHARELKFELFGKEHDFLAPLPQDFEDFMQSFQNRKK